MVLCAGLGTRLRPLTEELPKPLVPVGDRPILAHIVERLLAAGVDSVVVNVHHLPEVFFREIERLRLPIEVIHEAQIRGTAGGLAGARHRLDPAPVIAWNGDSWVHPPLGRLLAEAGSGLCLAVAPRRPGEGTLGMGEDGRVVRLRGERFGSELCGGDYVGGAALGAPELRGGGCVTTVEVADGFLDVGEPCSYLEANLEWLGQQRQGHQAWVGPGAEVASSVVLEQTVVGAGARVAGAGDLRRCVIWPGAVARAPLSDCVVLTSGRAVSTRGR